VEIGSISNPGDNTTLANWVGLMSSLKWPTFTCLPLGLLAELPSPAALLEVPSPKTMLVQHITILEHYKKNKQFQ
jgi:hypothetical protein